MKNKDEDKIEFIPSVISPIIEPSTLIENNQKERTQTHNDQSLKAPGHYELRKLLTKPCWSNPFAEGRYE